MNKWEYVWFGYPYTNLSLDDRKRVIKLEVFLNSNCNMNCSYCYKDAFAPFNTGAYKLDKIKDSFIEINNNIPKESELNLYIGGGGESLLYFSDLIDFIKFVRLQRENIRVFITTNGTLLTKDIVSQLKEEKVIIRFSFDGFYSDRYKSKIGDMDNKFIEVLESYLVGYPDVTIATSLTKSNTKAYCYILDYLLKLGYRDFMTTFVYGDMAPRFREKLLFFREIRKRWTKTKFKSNFITSSKMNHTMADTRVNQSAIILSDGKIYGYNKLPFMKPLDMLSDKFYLSSKVEEILRKFYLDGIEKQVKYV